MMSIFIPIAPAPTHGNRIGSIPYLTLYRKVLYITTRLFLSVQRARLCSKGARKSPIWQRRVDDVKTCRVLWKTKPKPPNARLAVRGRRPLQAGLLPRNSWEIVRLFSFADVPFR